MIDKLHSQGSIRSIGYVGVFARISVNAMKMPRSFPVKAMSFWLHNADVACCHIVPASGRLWFWSPTQLLQVVIVFVEDKNPETNK